MTMPFGFNGGVPMRCLLALTLASIPSFAVHAAEPPITVERLLGDGWEVAGYTGTLDNRSTVILFRHKDKKYLVQCSILYDVTRTPRMNTNCYEVR
jgi:hypothetical protein